MKTPEEILNSYGYVTMLKTNPGLIKAMQEYADQFTPSKISIGEIEKKVFKILDESNGHAGGGSDIMELLKSILASDAGEFLEWVLESGFKKCKITDSTKENRPERFVWMKQDDISKEYTTSELYSLFSSNKEKGANIT